MKNSDRLLIKNGTVYDGTGASGVRADIAIADGLIQEVNERIELPNYQVIDASGLAVSPGFIDVKTHSDFSLPLNPTADSKILQGVTTEIIGHCGFTAAPVRSGKVELLADYLSALAGATKFRVTAFGPYMDSFPKTSVNVGMLVGYNTIRLMVMGMDSRPPTARQLSEMIESLEEALAAGALGLSVGLFTPPGAYARQADLVALGQILARYKAGYFFHLRDESIRVLESVAEVIDLAERCGVHTQICHFKCSGLDSWGKSEAVARMVMDAKARGLAVDLDLYPYTAAVNPLRNLLPQWAQADGTDAMVDRLADPDVRERIRADLSKYGLTNFGHIDSWDTIQISDSPTFPSHIGRKLGAVADELGEDPVDLICRMLVSDRCATLVLVFSIDEADIRQLLSSTFALVGSDGNCVSHLGPTRIGSPHPRYFGTFPRVLGKYVEREHVLTLERALHKMTGASARAMRMSDRGFLQRGLRADVTIFDPANFVDRATYEDPYQYPSGSRTTVIVNGVVVVRDSAHTGKTPGVILRRRDDGSVR
jgi:N-acyl-D-amino-acid deacylase